MIIYKHLPEEEDGRLEWLHQQDCFSYVSLHYPHLLFFHVPNETGKKTSAKAVSKRTRAGVVKGVSDNIILSPTSKGDHPFSAIELKRPSKSARLKPEQKSFGSRIDDGSGLFVVCYGVMAFRRFLADFY